MGVEKGTRLLLLQHLAEGTSSPFVGTEARERSPETEESTPAFTVDDEILEPPMEETQELTPPTLRERVGSALQGISHRLIDKAS